MSTGELLGQDDLDAITRYVTLSHGANITHLALTSAASGLMACTCLIVIYQYLKRNCTCLRKADIRKIPGVGPFLLKSGYDKFEKFTTLVQVHSVKDLPKTSAIGNPKLYAVIQARYEQVKTRVSAFGKWEQSSTLVIPQGTDELILTVYDQKTLSGDTEVGSAFIEIEGTLKNNASFYGKKKTFKLEREDSAGAFGQISVTFRPAGEKGGAEEPYIKDMDPDAKPALYGAILDIVSEMDESKVPRNLEGIPKLEFLARVLQGKLASNKSKDSVFCAVVELYPPTESDSESSDVDMETLAQKAKQKGLSYIPKKWFWATYKSKKDFLKTPDKPESQFPILSISSVHVDPQSPGDMYIRYHAKGPKKSKIELKYKCTDTDVEAWADALEMFREECRALKAKQSKREEEWGQLSLDDKFKEWIEFYKGQGYTDDELKQYYEQYTVSQLPEEQRRAYLDQKTKNEFYKKPANALPSKQSSSST